MRYPISKPLLAGREREYVIDALDSGWISSTGAYVSRFEDALAGLIGAPEPISVCNGTVALHLACLAMGLSHGDEVVVPALTYVASANAVAYCGAKPVFAEADSATWNATRETIEAAITPKTVGVIAVHLYGLPCFIKEIAALCEERGLWLIEDCAESIGATVDGSWTGTFGDAATFSFYGNKIISTGEGGLVAVRDPQRRAHARMLRGQGMDPQRRYWHPILGYNYRMTNIAAAIGLGQAEMMDYHLGERRRIAETYRRLLAPLDGDIQLPATPDGMVSSSWLFSVLIKGDARRRDLVCRQLEADGVETRPFFVPMHQLPMYAESPGRFPVAERLAATGINLPTYAGLSDGGIEEICGALRAALLATA